MTTTIPRRFEILRENFNVDIRYAIGDGIEHWELIALAGAIAEMLIENLPVEAQRFGRDAVCNGLIKRFP